MREIRVAVADGREFDRQGVISVLSREPDLRVVGGFSTVADLLFEFEVIEPDVIVLDEGSQGLPPAAACDAIRRKRPLSAPIVLTSRPSRDVTSSCLAAGAHAVMSKQVSGGDLAQGVRAAVRQPATLGRHVEGPKASASGTGSREQFLAVRELLTLHFTAAGMTNGQIGRRLSVSVGTVKGDLRKAIQKLGMQNRAQAVAEAMHRGLIS